jgi:hypothetical protein
MKSKDVFDITYKLKNLSDEARELIFLLHRAGAPEWLVRKVQAFAEYTANLAGFIRVHEEWPPPPQELTPAATPFQIPKILPPGSR